MHVAALLDPEVDGERLLVGAAPCNWNDVLGVMRRLYPNRSFMGDLEGMGKLDVTVDDALQLSLLKKWGHGQEGWRSLEESVKATLEGVVD